ncbi:cytochrome c maturation protein CcmE [Reinekea blandensis]|uniref:Cytochrome c-type biogenesis protein CcmE n=1 Tax=Reinekea blandensis MED297 TaxID=314283 RepID=A4BHF0_9GAMM|nr:cytochrome c maturation protein CcmE [Reinekea blandensis]EAR08498.1 cytochrome C-type biogenesis protein CcmE [Reinekea sp. MED297] [Reinekea blandensis MED297]
MNPKRKQRLLLILLGVSAVGVAAALVLFALRQNVNFFFTPSEISSGVAPTEQVIRAGGMVREGSVKREDGSLRVHFNVTDFAADVAVMYDGILPDLFREGDGVVVIGKLDETGLLTADTVLAKHDETYMPPEVTHALEQAGHPDTTN